MFTDQRYIANSILNYEMDIDHFSKTEMNEWLSAHGIGKHVLAISGGTLPSRKF
jgi:hypothetical protein